MEDSFISTGSVRSRSGAEESYSRVHDAGTVRNEFAEEHHRRAAKHAQAAYDKAGGAVCPGLVRLHVCPDGTFNAEVAALLSDGSKDPAQGTMTLRDLVGRVNRCPCNQGVQRRSCAHGLLALYALVQSRDDAQRRVSWSAYLEGTSQHLGVRFGATRYCSLERGMIPLLGELLPGEHFEHVPLLLVHSVDRPVQVTRESDETFAGYPDVRTRGATPAGAYTARA